MIGDRVNRVQNQPWISNLAAKGLSTTWRCVSFRSSPCRLAILAVLFNCPKSSILGRSERTFDCQARSILSLWSRNISLSLSGGIKSATPRRWQHGFWDNQHNWQTINQHTGVHGTLGDLCSCYRHASMLQYIAFRSLTFVSRES